MRNLGDYPVTDDEIVDFLRKLRGDLTGGDRRVGDIRPTLIDAAIERIADHPRPAARIGVNIPYRRYASQPSPPASGRGWIARLFRPKAR